MTTSTLIGISDIAEAAGVGTSAVGNWRKRHSSFPTPRLQAPSGALFDLHEVEAWLVENGKIARRIPRDLVIWRLVDDLRGVMSVDEVASALVSGLVYQEASERAGTEGSKISIAESNRWHAVASDPEDFSTRLLESLATVEAENPALEGLMVVGFTQVTDRGAWTAVRELLEGLAVVTADEEVSRSDLFERLLARLERVDRFRGSHSTPDPLARLLTRLGGVTSGVVIDLAAGEGRLLLEAARHLGPGCQYIGVERDREAVRIARSRFFLHGLSARFQCTDVFRASDLPPADLVLLDPPLGQREWGDSEVYLSDRWIYGLPSPKSADLAWLQLAATSLAPAGRAVVLQPESSSFRAGRDEEIRSAMVQAGVVEAVIALPARLRAETSIPLMVWMLGSPKVPPSDVLMVDATGLGAAGRSTHGFEDSDIDTVLEVMRSASAEAGSSEETGHADLSWWVPAQAILDDVDISLAPGRYRPEEAVDLAALAQTAADLRTRVAVALDDCVAAVRRLAPLGTGDFSGPASDAEIRPIRDVAKILRGAVPSKPTDDGVPFFGLAEISSGGGGLRKVDPAHVKETAPRLRAGDVVVALLGDIGASAIVSQESEGAVLGRECVALRSSDAGQLSTEWIYVWTKSPHFQRQVERGITGTTMPRLALRAFDDFVIPVPPLSTQRRESAGVDALSAAVRAAGELLVELDRLEEAEIGLLVGRVVGGTNR